MVDVIRDSGKYADATPIYLGAEASPSATPGVLGVGTIPVGAGVTLYMGNAYYIDASGNAQAITSSTNQSTFQVGVYEGLTQIPEGSGTLVGAASGVYTVLTESTFRFKNSATNAVVAANIGSIGYFETGSIVANIAATNSPKAGQILAIDSDGMVVVNMQKTS